MRRDDRGRRWTEGVHDVGRRRPLRPVRVEEHDVRVAREPLRRRSGRVAAGELDIPPVVDRCVPACVADPPPVVVHGTDLAARAGACDGLSTDTARQIQQHPAREPLGPPGGRLEVRGDTEPLGIEEHRTGARIDTPADRLDPLGGEVDHLLQFPDAPELATDGGPALPGPEQPLRALNGLLRQRHPPPQRAGRHEVCRCPPEAATAGSPAYA